LSIETICADIIEDPGLDNKGPRVESGAAPVDEMPSWAEWRRSRAAWWREHVEARRVSGESRTDYCRRHGLNPGGLYHWERKLGPLTGEARGAARSASSPSVSVAGGGWSAVPSIDRPAGHAKGSNPGDGWPAVPPIGRAAGPVRGNVPDGDWPTGPSNGEASANSGVRFLPLGLLAVGPASGGLQLWVGKARIEVERGFDGELLREVVLALGRS
jgi:hypothetical protein